MLRKLCDTIGMLRKAGYTEEAGRMAELFVKVINKRKSPKPYEKAASHNDVQDITEDVMQIREEQKKKRLPSGEIPRKELRNPEKGRTWKKHRQTQHKPVEAKDKYVSEEGHFKGKEGSGERWDNCVKHFQSKGKSKESAEKLCGYIRSRKGSTEALKKIANILKDDCPECVQMSLKEINDG